MKIQIKRLLASLLLLILILSTPLASYAQNQRLDTDYFGSILDIVQDYYIEEKSTEDYLENSLKGLLKNLDSHSEYYTKEEFSKLNENLQGNFVGIGAYIAEENGYIKIVQPIKGSPAEKAGLLPNDIIITVNGRITKGKTAEEVSNLIRGEKGTRVRLRVLRDRAMLTIRPVRDDIVINPVEYKIMDGNIGYISLDQFNENAYKNMLKALEYMDKNRVSKLILDLRNNPGGYLDQAIYISNLFVPEGPVVHVQYGRKDKESYYSYLNKPKYDLILLVNEYSASASEIVAGAIKDTKVATIVGVTTYGKGSVQQVLTLARGDGLKLTIAEYFSPNMNKIDGIGVKPDIVVENDGQEDLQLKEAIKMLSY